MRAMAVTLSLFYKQMLYFTLYLLYSNMDLRLVNGAVFQVVGPSGSGKTHFVINLLSSQNVFKELTRHIYWLMGTSEGESGDTQKQFKSLKT